MEDELQDKDVQKTEVVNIPAALSDLKGTFIGALVRSNRKIKEDRARDIIEGAQTKYKREVEDLVMSIKKLKRTRDSKLDLNPSTTQSLQFEAFDEAAFVATDIQLTKEIAQKELLLKEMLIRYDTLFGEQIEIKH